MKPSTKVVMMVLFLAGISQYGGGVIDFSDTAFMMGAIFFGLYGIIETLEEGMDV